jgi:hypothetical protein
VPLDYDPLHFSVYQKGPVSIDRQAETHQYALVMRKIIGLLRRPFIFQIWRGGAHNAPVLAEALDAQGTVRQFAIPDGKVLSLPYKINITICQIEIDGHFWVLGQECIEDGNDVAPAKVDRRAKPNRS